MMPNSNYDFIFFLRGIAVLSVVLIAHFLGVFWLNQGAVSGLLGVENFKISTIPQWVLIFHTITYINWGHLGVSLFFLISGFVIPFSCEKLKPKSFLIARFFRIYPTWWVGFSLSLFTLICFNTQNTSLSKNAILHHYFLTRDLAWIPSLDGISWTLEIELKFYMLCALIRKIITDARLKSMFFIVCILGIISILPTYLTFFNLTAPWHGIVASISIDAMFIIYMFTGTLFYWHSIGRITNTNLVFYVIAIFLYFSLTWKFNNYLAIQYLSGSVNYLLSLMIFSGFYIIRNNLKTPKILRWCADISYSLYVVHPIVGYGLLYYLIYVKGFDKVYSTFTTVIITFTLALLVNRIVEIPTNTLGKKIARRLL